MLTQCGCIDVVIIRKIVFTETFQELPKEILMMESAVGLLDFDLQHTRAMGTISHCARNR